MKRGGRGAELADRATDWLLRAILAVLGRLPYPRRVALGGALARRVIGPLAGYRRRALANLALIHPDWPEARRRAVATASLDNFGRTLIENYSGDALARQLADTVPAGPGVAALAEARAAGRAVLFVTGHFGNHEVPRRCLAAQGYRIGGIYRAMKNRHVNAHYVTTLSSVSGEVFEQGRETTGFVRALKAGGMMTILFDVHDARGIPLPFLGRAALTTTSPADLALRYDALVLPYFGIRRENGLDFDVAVEAPVPHGPPEDMMREMTRRLEARIAAHPAQWLWVHRRWKYRPEG
ncbi:MAG: lauroyl acyltransferase [Rubellimicrobium sp.]|nr:lauroyl acyltransferase [Rubellimicrobium sp.]